MARRTRTRSCSARCAPATSARSPRSSDKYGPSLLRVAHLYVSRRAVAEEVVQETWLAVFTGLERFEGRSSFKTWLFRILTNKAKTRGQREARTLPFSAFAADGDEDGTRSTSTASRADGARGTRPPRGVPEERLLAGEARRAVETAIAALPAEPAGGDHAPRRRGPVGRGGVQRSRRVRDESTGAAPPRPREGPGGIRASTWRTHERNRRDLACQEIVELVTDYLEGAMDAELRRSFEAHLAGCPHCTHYLEQIEATIRVAGTIEADALSPEFRAGLLEAFRELERP